MTTRRTWIKLFVDKTLRGTMFQEMEDPAERFVWFGFLLLAGDSAFDGKIALTETMGYTDAQIAELLKVDIAVLRRAKRKMIKYDKIIVRDNNIIEIVNWRKYQSEYQRQKPYRDKEELQEEVTNSGDNQIEIEIEKKKKEEKIRKEHIGQIIEYFNGITHQKRSETCAETVKLIQGRLNEGRTFEDFKHVIDTKFCQWRKDKMMKRFIRPSTLFRQGNFEDYLNEPYEDPYKKEYQVGKSYKKKIKQPDFEAHREEFVEYLKKTKDPDTERLRDDRAINDIMNLAEAYWHKLKMRWYDHANRGEQTPEVYFKLLEKLIKGEIR